MRDNGDNNGIVCHTVMVFFTLYTVSFNSCAMRERESHTVYYFVVYNISQCENIKSEFHLCK